MGTTGRPAKIISFYSFKGGAGRTMALANTAWIMASQGKSVLVVDWDLEAPGLHLYYGAYLPVSDLSHGSGVLDMFSAFADAATTGADIPEDLRALHAEHTNFDRYRVRLDHRFPKGGELHYIGPGRMDDDYANRLHEFDWGKFQASDDGREFLEALRARMLHESPYDYILIDSRTGFSDGAGICTLMLPDTVVITLAMNRQAIQGARQIAQRIKRSPRPIRLHVLPMRIDTSEKIRLENCMAEARQALDPCLDLADESALAVYWGQVQVPYRAFYAYGEELAVMEEDPRQSHSLLAEYVKAVARITDGDVTEFNRVPPADLLRYHRLLDSLRHKTAQVTEPQTLSIVHAPNDRLWADWITEQLRPAGFEVVAHPNHGAPAEALPDPDYVLALLSPHLTGTPAEETVRRLNSEALLGSRPREQQVVRLRLGTARLATYLDWPGTPDLAVPSEESARRTLLTQFGLRPGEEPQPAPVAGPRFPGLSPAVWNLPMPNAGFVGRDEQLSALRAEFESGASAYSAPQVLYGMKGVGKRQIALEYAHRFASQYDLVWWVPAAGPELIRESFTALARALNRLSGGARTGEDPEAVLDDLRQRRHASRWLLVFDGAESETTVEPFIPGGGTGHVLLTSTNSRWSDRFTSHLVDVFTPEESLALLSRKLPGASDEELSRLAERTGHLALVEQTAAADLRRFPQSVDAYIARLDDGGLPRTDEEPDSEYGAFARIHRQAYDNLLRSSPAAGRILQLCSFLSPDGVGLNVILSKWMLSVVQGLEPGLTDTLELQSRVKRIDDHVLGVLDYRSRTLKVHRIVQDLVRDWMSDEERDQARDLALTVLADMVPEDMDRHKPEFREIFAELDRHVLPSKAPESDNPKVHGWLVSQVYHRWMSGRWEAARELGELVLDQWRTARGPDDTMVLRMESQVAAACRMLGRYRDSLRLSRHAVHTQRRQQVRGAGPDLYTLLASRGYAADLRAEGEFRDAYEEDSRTFSGLNRLIGSSHNATLSASHNLAWSKYFMEGAEAAVRQQQSTYDQRCQVMPPDDPWTWVAYGDLGTFYREAGQLEASEQCLVEARNQLHAIAGEHSPHTLNVVASLGLTMIRQGRVQHGQPLLQNAHVGFRELWGDDHPSTMSCHMAVAIGLHAEGLTTKDRTTEAAEYIREELDRYVRAFGDSHPFTGICHNNLALYLLAREETAEEAAEHARKAVHQLKESFGRAHRFTLVARMNQNNCLTVLGEGTSVERATEDEDIYEGCLQPSAWGTRHPVTLTAIANLLSSRPEAHQELAPILTRRVDEYFLKGHPLAKTLLAKPYGRNGADLEVQSV
ncbi:FxSxx-COOH system tetratricopeptide repeat protein [Streptomyces justiciae]|uniref:FxSxx-COOH system tetratricopeptide repeat protein n=1 Tax=Streptomyces justiciae TaxID=2780140 RepID=UPI001D137726|nr:FxSxx-COOH system tetratricopeptide repeat protein [Streptomyces justiciae]